MGQEAIAFNEDTVGLDGRTASTPVKVSATKKLPVDAGDVTSNGENLATETTLAEANNSLATANTHLSAIKTASEDTTAVNVYPAPTTPVSGMTSAMTGTTSTAVTGVGAGGSGIFNYITSIVASNTDADTGTLVQLQDGSGGTAFYSFPVPAAVNSAGAAGIVIPLPTPIKQPTANTALYAVNVTTGASVIVSVAGYQA